MRRLRLYFALFFILLAVPIGILIKHSYANLEQESFFFYRKTAEGLMAIISERFQQSLGREEQRPYTHYRYIHVADRAIPRQEGLNVSPLATFPVQSEVPGILGYYQIDPDGSFHTPLLPDGASDNEIPVPQREERTRIRDQLASIVQGRAFRLSTGLRDKQEGLRSGEDAPAREPTVSTLRENLESNVDFRLERKYYRRERPETALSTRDEKGKKAEGTPYLQRRVQKTSAKQVQVFESQNKDIYSDQAARAKEQDVLAPRSDMVPGTVAAGRQERLLETEERLRVPADFDAGAEMVAEVDPFTSSLIDKEWLVFHRKVWWHDRRYIQGFVTRFSEFFEAQVKPAFLNSALPATASHLVFYQGEILPPAGNRPGEERPLLLYNSALPHPLNDFHLAITVGGLPQSPGHHVVNVLAILLSLLFISGFLGIYRLTATHMELSQKKSDFVAAVSHELKTPLTAIRMYGEMLREGWVEDEKKDRYYRHIHDESERLTRLIQNVLTLAELERKEWQISLASHNPEELVRDVLDRLSNQVRGVGFEIETRTEGEPKPIQVDSDAFIQILINLIDNALKFAKDAETKKIVLTLSQVGNECSIRVRDFGPGIPRRKLKKIFEQFYRVDSAMSRPTRGTGIGLALVKMLADAMGAQVDVSNRRPGAEFSIRLPSASH